MGLCCANFAGHSDQMLFMVCDGHGSGHKVSQIASKSIVNTLEADDRMKNMLANPEFTKGGVVQALTEACEQAQRDLVAQLSTEAKYSGTTCICTVIHKNHVWTACVGDSRAVVGAMKGEKVLALDLSADQCCSNTAEKARIVAAGGTVAEFGGFERVVAPDQNTVLAPTRSIGDCEFDEVGVIPTPEVTHFKLTGQEHVIILASDGLWEFISSSHAVNLAINCTNATEACHQLVQLSKSKWAQDGAGTYCDDITIIVIFLPLVSGQLGSQAIAVERVGMEVPTSPTDSDDIQIDMANSGVGGDQAGFDPHNQSVEASKEPDGTTGARRRSLSELTVEDGKTKAGQDRSIVELNKRNIDNFQGLNPNSRDNVPHHSWSPEWNRTMWPKA